MQTRQFYVAILQLKYLQVKGPLYCMRSCDVIFTSQFTLKIGNQSSGRCIYRSIIRWIILHSDGLFIHVQIYMSQKL